MLRTSGSQLRTDSHEPPPDLLVSQSRVFVSFVQTRYFRLQLQIAEVVPRNETNS